MTCRTSSGPGWTAITCSRGRSEPEPPYPLLHAGRPCKQVGRDKFGNILVRFQDQSSEIVKADEVRRRS